MSTLQTTEALIEVGDDLVEQTITAHEQLLHNHHHSSNYNSTSSQSNPSGLDSNVHDSDDHQDSDFESDSDDDLYDVYGNKFPVTLSREFMVVPKSKRPNYKLLFFIIGLYITGFAAVLPSLLDALVYLICHQDFPATSSPIQPFMSNNGFNDPRCFAPEISAAVGMFQSYQTIINAIFSTFTIPLVSSLSDRVGRKPLLVVSIFLSVLSLSVTLICASFPAKVSYKYILLSSVFEGLGGGMLVMGILLSAYVSDAVREAYRAPILSISEAILYGGLALGPVVGSAFLNMTDHSITSLFMCSIGMELLALLIVIIWLPESRSDKARRKSISHYNRNRQNSSVNSVSGTSTKYRIAETIAEKVGHAKHTLLLPLDTFKLKHIPRHQTRIRFNVYILMCVYSSIIELGTSVIPLIFIYAKLQFKWTSVENGYFISVLAGSKFIVLALILPSLLTWFRQHYDHSKNYIDRSDMLFLRFGLVISFTAYFLLSRAPNGTVFLMTAFLFALSSCETPVLKNALIKFAERGRVAELLGLSQFISKVGSIFVPALFAWIFNKTVSFRPQLVLELVAGILLLLLIAVNFLYVGPPPEETVSDDN